MARSDGDFLPDDRRTQIDRHAPIEHVQSDVIDADRRLRIRERDHADAVLRVVADEGSEAADAAVLPRDLAASRAMDVPRQADLRRWLHATRPGRCGHRAHGGLQGGTPVAEDRFEQVEQVVGGRAQAAGTFERPEVPARHRLEFVVVAGRPPAFHGPGRIDPGVGHAERLRDARPKQVPVAGVGL